jgi:predicted GNAT family acetyltransferase
VSELLRGLFDSGRNIGWLNAANEQARSVYAKLGFRSIGSLLNYED